MARQPRHTPTRSRPPLGCSGEPDHRRRDGSAGTLHRSGGSNGGAACGEWDLGVGRAAHTYRLPQHQATHRIKRSERCTRRGRISCCWTGNGRSGRTGSVDLIGSPQRSGARDHRGGRFQSVTVPGPSSRRRELGSAPTWTGWTVPQRPRYRPKTPVPSPRPSVTSQNREEGGTCARTREAASRAASQGVVAGHGTKVRGWGQDRREAGTRGAWGDRPGGSCSRGSWRTGSSGTIGVRRTRCSVRRVRDSGARGGGCQGTRTPGGAQGGAPGRRRLGCGGGSVADSGGRAVTGKSSRRAEARDRCGGVPLPRPYAPAATSHAVSPAHCSVGLPYLPWN